VAGVAPAPHTALDKLSPLKVRDLHHLAQILCPSGESDAVYPPARPPAHWEELAQATAAECAEMKGRGGTTTSWKKQPSLRQSPHPSSHPQRRPLTTPPTAYPKCCLRALQDFFDVPFLVLPADVVVFVVRSVVAIELCGLLLNFFTYIQGY